MARSLIGPGNGVEADADLSALLSTIPDFLG